MNEKEIKDIVAKNLKFKRNPLLLIKALFFIFVISILIIYSFSIHSLILKIIIGWVIGYLWGCNALFVHELLHGSIIKNKKIQDIYAIISYSTYFQTPTFWRYWHNNLHHNNTNIPHKDPDYIIKPNGKSKIYSMIYSLLPDSKSFFSHFYVFYWMNFQSLLGHFILRFTNGKWKKLITIK